MKRFVKGELETVVDDSDRRIPEYIAGGWKATELWEKPRNGSDGEVGRAIADVNTFGRDDGKCVAADRKVNEAVKANGFAARESEAIDDGLIQSGGKG